MPSLQMMAILMMAIFLNMTNATNATNSSGSTTSADAAVGRLEEAVQNGTNVIPMTIGQGVQNRDYRDRKGSTREERVIVGFGSLILDGLWSSTTE